MKIRFSQWKTFADHSFLLCQRTPCPQILLSQITTKPCNLWKFSPSKVSRYTVYNLPIYILGHTQMQMESLMGSKVLSYFAYVSSCVCLSRSASCRCCLWKSFSARRCHCTLPWLIYSSRIHIHQVDHWVLQTKPRFEPQRVKNPLKLWCLKLWCLVSTKWLQTSRNAY